MPKKNKDEPRVIKKYSNRRLYDTAQSKYITLEELRDMTLSGTPYQVVTTQGEDITCQCLLQILLSNEVMGQQILSEQTLRNMVMFTYGPMRGPTRIFFEQCFPLFAQTQQRMMDKFGSAAVGNQEMESLAMLQGNMVRQFMEQYVCRGLENYLSAQKNMEKMMTAQPFSFPNLFNPGGGDKND